MNRGICFQIIKEKLTYQLTYKKDAFQESLS